MNKTKASLGPLPPAPEPSADLSRPRSAVLAAVEEHAPATLAELAAATGLHVNTVREHLEALLEGGFLRRETATRAGRGRPAWLYRPVPRLARSVTEYAGLASVLADTIRRLSSNPAEDAVRAGLGWGAELAEQRGLPNEDEGAPVRRRRVTEMFEGMGFEPRPDAEHVEVRLTRCPLLDAARKHPEVVCGVHRGTARAALDTYGLDGSRADLLPFAEPGACLLLLDIPQENR